MALPLTVVVFAGFKVINFNGFVSWVNINVIDLTGERNAV